MRGKDIKQYLKEDAYKEAFPAFRQTFESIVTSRGGTVEETRARFGNDMMNDLLFGIPEPPAPTPPAPAPAATDGDSSGICGLRLPSWLTLCCGKS